MQPFTYARPTRLADAVALLAEHGSGARCLAGGTDLIIRLRDGTLAPDLVVDVKAIPELRPSIRQAGDTVTISGGTTMAEIASDPLVRGRFPALAEAAAVVGAVQIRNRATLAGNVCNASPAADTAPPLLVYGAVVVAVGRGGPRRIPLERFFIRSGETALATGELVSVVELPLPRGATGSAYARRTRRRGHDLASVTLACLVDGSGVTRVAYGSVGPRPVLVLDESGVLADPLATDAQRATAFDGLFADATPSVRSMRAGPEYRLAMLRVLAGRALTVAHERFVAAR